MPSSVAPILSTTTIENTHYVRAGDQVVLISKRTKVGAGAMSAHVPRYTHRDHLGSITSLTDAGGALLERSGFDPWGKRTDFQTWNPPAPNTFVPGGSGSGGNTSKVVSTKRGYTGHEHVDELGFIHMNGRIYDPELGRFFSADPTMQFPFSTQGFNRYAYAGNNPLTNIDPSGFSFWKSVMKVVGFALQFVAFAIPVLCVIGNMMLKGFVTGFLMSGGDLKAGLLSAVTAGLGGGFAKGLGNFMSKGLASFVGGMLASISVSMAMGQKFGQALVGFAKGVVRGMIEGAIASATGIADLIQESVSAMTSRREHVTEAKLAQPGTGNAAASGEVIKGMTRSEAQAVVDAASRNLVQQTFDTPDDAARALHAELLSVSKAIGREIGANIFRVGRGRGGYFVIGSPVVGSDRDVMIYWESKPRVTGNLQKRVTLVGNWHTHPDTFVDRFSSRFTNDEDADLEGYIATGAKSSYVSTVLTGNMLKFDGAGWQKQFGRMDGTQEQMRSFTCMVIGTSQVYASCAP